jgi:hypothetical protein
MKTVRFSATGDAMTDRATLARKLQIDALRRDRAVLVEKIKESQETIKRSQALLKRMDDILAKAGEKP